MRAVAFDFDGVLCDSSREVFVVAVDTYQLLRPDSALAARHDIDWHWVKGHAGHPENERADALARAGMAPFKP